MVPYCLYIIILLYWMEVTVSMSLLNDNPTASINSNTARDVTDFIKTKEYIPNEQIIPKPSIVTSGDNDVTYLLSKLSDEDLIKLLNEQPNKHNFEVKDILKITSNTKYPPNDNVMANLGQSLKGSHFPNANLVKNTKKKRFETISKPNSPQSAVFRLENKEVDPIAKPIMVGTQYAAEQKLHNLLYSRPAEAIPENKNLDDDEKKELLFDVLVAQLKTLCCKKTKPLKNNENSILKLKSVLNDLIPQKQTAKTYSSKLSNVETMVPSEHLFLILNDDIKSKDNDGDLISVDPDSLGKNSSVMLLGPIATPLSDIQLKVLMMQISNELSKPEYLPLLHQIADGLLNSDDVGFLDSIIRGPQTRRYIKPHRCNDQSQLTRIYGGPKWIICTGYLNLNKPSLYD